MYPHRLLGPIVNLCTLPMLYPLHTCSHPPLPCLHQQHTTIPPQSLLIPLTTTLWHTEVQALPLPCLPYVHRITQSK
ncbi:hypothetical protein L210DRAFT_3527127 [Boletus edulis BED1]|uniref:Uncharacterized protein n=1 Tax=Boletus edulis BED1 TaxID=1328754 RepID=A0AAD4GJE5_BOLED|nr:hypothetical protein L210DRAFT_3527127 [Boletus edulis BED1]